MSGLLALPLAEAKQRSQPRIDGLVGAGAGIEVAVGAARRAEPAAALGADRLEREAEVELLGCHRLELELSLFGHDLGGGIVVIGRLGRCRGADHAELEARTSGPGERLEAPAALQTQRRP